MRYVGQHLVALDSKVHVKAHLQDHEAQRTSEIGTINGAILKLGNELNMPAPYNETICAVIRAREAQFD